MSGADWNPTPAERAERIAEVEYHAACDELERVEAQYATTPGRQGYFLRARANHRYALAILAIRRLSDPDAELGDVCGPTGAPALIQLGGRTSWPKRPLD